MYLESPFHNKTERHTLLLAYYLVRNVSGKNSVNQINLKVANAYFSLYVLTIHYVPNIKLTFKVRYQVYINVIIHDFCLGIHLIKEIGDINNTR